ncbi:MAG: TonB-dependent receptor plug domain-containing protein, partial [Parabacteroides sp.]|nr:TonB-dependent receptor plug domain-containing protein [Parabacteroides sp.]
MKITTFFLLVTVCSITASTYAQNYKVSINKQNSSIIEILKEIEGSSEFTFFFNNNQVDATKKASVNAKNANIEDVLNQILSNTGYTYKIMDRQVLIRAKESADPSLKTYQTSQQNKKVTGAITDERGEAIIGANVMVKGSKSGTITDIDGNFSLDVPDGAILQISYIGYLSQEVPVGGKSSLKIVIREDTQRLDEVIVVGYGTQKKVNLTGAVEQVTSEVFENRSVPNVSQALQGAIPNLNITLEDGKPTRSASFNVRGTTSIGQGGDALVLIDGVEGDPSMLNPNDIASVSVLKDASSSAIYGARGTFGVVLITTKTPDKEKMSITYSGDFAVKTPTTVPDFVTDGYTYASMFNEAYSAWNNYSATPKNINKSQTFSSAWLDTFKQRNEQGITDEVEIGADGTYTYYGNTDYMKELYKIQIYAQDQNLS